MQSAIGIALPFFAVILCGYLAARFRVLPEGGIAGVNAFVFWFALPCMLFTTIAGTPFARLLDTQFLLAYTLASLVVFGAALASARTLFGSRGGDLAMHGMAAFFDNTGYMGLPLIVAAMSAAVLVSTAISIVSVSALIALAHR